MRTKTQLIAAAAAATFITAATAHAVSIGFEDVEGYTAGGTVAAQPSAGSTWFVNNNQSLFSVVAGSGVGGTNGLEIDSSINPTGGSTLADFQASPADWGVASLSGFGGLATVSFDIKIDAINTVDPDNNNAFVIRPFKGIAGRPGEIRILDNGTLRLQGTGNDDAVGAFTVGEFESFTIVADYANQVLTLTGGDIDPLDPLTVPFLGSADDTLGEFRLTSINSRIASLDTVTVDNISLTTAPIPEPASALAALGMLGALGIRRRR
ncbi:MAG: hypothetical protein AAF743_13555 [Planctomycetota bacterium]